MSQILQARRHHENRRGYPSPAAARRNGPQPHQPVRLHRQQVRVPRPRFQPVLRRRKRGHQHHRGRSARQDLRRTRKVPEEKLQRKTPGSPPEDHQDSQARDLQRRRLHGSVEEGSRKARSPERRHHSGSSRSIRLGEEQGALLQVQRLHRGRTGIPLRNLHGGIRQEDPH